jgi:predicted esterase
VPAHQHSRQQVIAHFNATTRHAPPTAQSACTLTDQGYLAEILVPWTDLNIDPHPGELASVQLCVNDGTSPGQKFSAVWFPALGAAVPANSYAVRLSDRASPPIRAAAYADYERFRRVRLFVNAATEPSGSIPGCTVAIPGMPTASEQLEPIGQHLTAQFWLPMMPPGQAYPFLRVQVGRSVLPELDLPDPTVARQNAFLHQDIHFDRTVFAGDTFPSCDFAQPAEVEDLIGPYTLTAKFFDELLNPVTTADKPGRYGAIVEIRTQDEKTYRRFATLCRADPAQEWWQSEDAAVENERGAVQSFARRELAIAAEHDPAAAAFTAWLHEQGGRPPSDGWPDYVAADDQWWFDLKTRTGTLDKRYIVRQPPGYSRDPSKRWPLLVFLHGSDQRGSQLNQYLGTSIAQTMSGRRVAPFLVLLPQCREEERWNPWTLNAMIEEVCNKYRVDEDRIDLIGFDLGGLGAWETAEAFPDLFAAIVPVCGRGNPTLMPRLRNVQVWAFHGSDDSVVPLSADQACVDALNAAGGSARVTVYPNAGHDIWPQTAANDQLFTWLLQQRRP